MTKDKFMAGAATVALIAALFAALMFAGLSFTPPPVRSVNRADQFDAPAAQARLARILGNQTPHPIDSSAQDAIRAALLHEIEAIGITPQIHEAFACRPQPRGPLIDCGHVRNIVFSIGPQSGPAILATSHYDSVPAGPGASDDGIGFSVWLEIARELAHAPLHKRIIFLISDGEEQALLGAYQFGQHDPLMTSVDTLVNLEARGTRGPAVFFESNQPNAAAVRAYANVPRPLANSIMADIYHVLPNSTDVTALTRPGLSVINIAVLDGVENYHTPHDTLTSQDLRSVQHMGDHALAIMRTLTSARDAGPRTSLVYTDIGSRFFIDAPSWLSHLLLALGTLVAGAAWWRAGAQARWRAFAVPVVALLIAGVSALIVGMGFNVLRPGEDYWFAYLAATRGWCIALGLFGLAATALMLGRNASAASLEASSFFWFGLLGTALSFVAPGISILFVVASVIYAIGVLAAWRWQKVQAPATFIAGLAALVIWAPMLALTELALGYDLPLVMAVLFALATLPWLGVLARLGAHWRTSTMLLTGAALVAIMIAAILPGATATHPQPLNLTYFYNTDSREARVLAGGAARALPRELKAGFAFAPELILPGDTRPYWAMAVTAQPMQGPQLANLRVENTAAGRVLHATLHMNGAYRFILRIPKSADPQSLTLQGANANFADVGAGAEPSDFVNVGCDGRTCDSADIAITLGAHGTNADAWYIVGQFLGAAAPAQAAIAHRPDTATPIQFGDSALTLSRLAV